ncbi:hypothetical protein PAXRUDRAFT_162240 [Paxillus rubicundulus Ve08.2h10]|uniref:Secreted protein n=1 Tax=Paxillus rubicundulus Ve08.2h10 TaxID=930991 RepID=A0A0D0DE49_9AGAM|nr:hypothetical protein PAXRUDRAFT_162240 [Paxillus rubicundulus Ve08.2h10]
MLTSATLTVLTLSNVVCLLHICTDSLVAIHCSSDHPNIKIGLKIKYTLNNYVDLAFLIPEGWKRDDPPPPKY